MRPDQRPTYHFLVFAPNLGAEWLFDAARQYWETFRPTVLPDFAFLRFIPPEQTLTVTVVALRDTIPMLGVELARTAPTAYLDAVVYDTFEQTRDELNRRAQMQQPFGVPLAQPTLDLPFIPTPWLPTRAPAGFVTATPPPTPTRPPSPTPPVIYPATPHLQPFPTNPPSEPQPIQRTPGPITDQDSPGIGVNSGT